MATSNNEDDLVICPICFEEFKDPKYLPCLHTFCHLCLKSYIISALGEGKPAKPFPCPVCRQVVEHTDGNVLSDKIADNMPGNQLIMSLIERSRISKDDNERSCDPCKYDKKNSRAVSWCIECLESFCENCSSVHKLLKQTRNHETVPIADVMKQQPMNMKTLDVDEPCNEHEGKILEVYCVDHKQMCCVICLATNHRKCENISTFEEMVKSTKYDDSIEDFIKRLQDVDEKTEVLKTKTEASMTCLDLKQEEMTKEVCTTVQLAKDKLDDLKEKFLLQLKQTHKQQNMQLVERKERIEAFQTCIKKGKKMMQTVREQGSPKQVFITKEKLKIQLEKHLTHMRNDLDTCADVDYVLHVDDAVTSVNNTLTSVAKVELKPTRGLAENLHDVFSAMGKVCFEQLKNVDIMEVKVDKVCDINVNDAQITVCTFHPNGNIVLCDVTNNNLILCDKERKALFRNKKVSKRPWDVACLSSTKIVVSYRFAKCLTQYEVIQGAFEELVTITCKNQPFGVDILNGNIVVAYRDCIDIMTQDGKCLSTITRKATYPYYFVVSKTGNIYYSEGDNLVCCSSDGKELFNYSHPLLTRPVGIALDRHCNVYVCGYSSNNIHLISSDGKKGRILLENISGPFRIGFSVDGESFAVSCVGHIHSVVSIYQCLESK